MELTKAELEQGRTWIRANNIDALKRWIEERKILIDRELVTGTFRKLACADPDRAVKLFDKVFEGMNPELDQRTLKIKLALTAAVILIIGLGCLGGIVYLVRSIL